MEYITKKDLTWLHISDIHFGHDKKIRHRVAQSMVTRKIIQDIDLMVDNLGSPDFIFVTGDIAFKSSSEEYDKAKLWFADLLKSTKCESHQLFIVPGNHDIDRARNQGFLTKKLMSGFRENPLDIDEYFNDKDTRRALWPKFTNYENFVKEIFPHCKISIDEPFWKKDFGGISIIGLNSCLNSFDDVDSNTNLCIGNVQLDMLCEQMSVDKLNIVLMHHPLSWLMDKGDISAQLQKYPHLLFVGHEHDLQTRIVSTFYQAGLIEFAAGAGTTSNNDSAEHAYSWGQSDQTGINFYPRAWNSKTKEFIHDFNTYQKAMDSESGAVHLAFDKLPVNLKEWYFSSNEIYLQESSNTIEGNVKDLSPVKDCLSFSKWTRKVMCYNQGEYSQFSWLASLYHKSLRINAEKDPYNFDLLKNSSGYLMNFLSRNFDKHFSENFLYLHEYFKLTKDSEFSPRVCIKSNLTRDKLNVVEEVVTLARDKYSDSFIPNDLNEYSYKDNSGFKYTKETGEQYLCNDIPAEARKKKYKNPRLVPSKAIKYKLKNTDSSVDPEWMNCWIKSDKTKETNALSCYKSTLIIPITLLKNDLDEGFIKKFHIRNNNGMKINKTIFGYLCFDHMEVNYFSDMDFNIGYFVADLLSLYFLTALNYTTASDTFMKLDEMLNNHEVTVKN